MPSHQRSQSLGAISGGRRRPSSRQVWSEQMAKVKNGIRVVLMAAVLGSGLMLAACNDDRPGYNSGHHHRHGHDHDGDRHDYHAY
jgi:hypothetical protein